MQVSEDPDNESADPDNKKSASGNGAESRYSRKITAEMSDSERAEILKDKVLVAPIYEGQADALISENEIKLESQKIDFAREAILDIAEKLEIIGQRIDVKDVELQIKLSKSNIRESIVKDATPKQIAKLLPILSKVVGDAVVIERHNNRYYYDTDTEYFDNLLGAYVEEDSLIPVRFGLKYSKTGNTILYVVVDQNKISIKNLEKRKNDRGPQDARSDKIIADSLHRSVSYSIAQIFSFVNSKDLLRYIPDDFLVEEQKKAKREAIAETDKYTEGKNDKKYYDYVGKGKIKAANTMLYFAAKAHGYDNGGDGITYKNPEGGSKRADITYDDEGNLIPISKRFDAGNSDPRYSYKRPAEGKVHKQIAEWEKLRVYEKVDAEKSALFSNL